MIMARLTAVFDLNTRMSYFHHVYSRKWHHPATVKKTCFFAYENQEQWLTKVAKVYEQ